MAHTAFASLFAVLSPVNLLANLIGVLFGLFIGATPGLTISLGMVLLLPVTYTLPPITSFSLLLGLFVSGMTGGSISAILLNIPGTPSASATALAGYKLSKKGRSAEAIATAVTSSFVGAMLSLVVLVLVSPIIARAALHFGSVELAALVFLGLALISSFAQESVVKGLVSGMLGLVLTTIGLDPITGTPRFTFGAVNLQNGINFLPVMIGLFAVPQVLSGIVLKAEVIPRVSREIRGVFSRITDVFKYMKYKVISSLIGIGIGAIPGAGGPIAVFLAYDNARRMSGKRKKEFDDGSPEGVAAPEAANSALTGGALIPLLTLGIPGDPITAVLLGALMLQGLTPGPLLFRTNPDFVYAVFWAFLVAAVLVLFVALLSIRVWVTVLRVPKWILLPVIAIFCVVGTYSLNNSFWDTGIMLIFGFMGFLMKRYGFPLVPMLLAIVLGPSFERNTRTALILSNGNASVFLTHPISLLFLLIALASILTPVIRKGVARLGPKDLKK